MSDQYIGEIRLFCGNYAPMGWEFCRGQLLPIPSYSTLFAVIGTRYGGDGVNNFALPDLQGRVAVGQGNGAGLTPRTIGAKTGTETVSLQPNESNHYHLIKTSVLKANSSDPLTRVLGAVPDSAAGNNLYRTDNTAPVAMHESSVGKLGQGQAHENMMPSLCINYIIALEGEFPVRE